MESLPEAGVSASASRSPAQRSEPFERAARGGRHAIAKPAAFAEAPFKLLMHCYTSGPELLARTAALGAWFSVSGIATFRNAEDVRDRVRAMPPERIIVETDCPYLAPVPHRGRRNEPAYVGLVLDKLAEVRGWAREEALARTADAFFALFDRIPRS